MVKVVIFVSICVIVASLCSGKSVKKREEAEVVGTDVDITLISLENAVENYNIGGSSSTKRQMDKIHPCIVVVYLLFTSCTYVPFWISDFTDRFRGGVMQIKYSTDPANMPTTWTDINQSPVDFFIGNHSLWTVYFGPFAPCTTVYIDAQLEKNGLTSYLGNFSVSTDDGSIQVGGVLVSGTTFVTSDGNIEIQVISEYMRLIFSVTAKWWILWIKNEQTKRNEIRFEIKDNSVLVEKQCGMLGPKYVDNTLHPFVGFIKPNGAITNDAIEHGNSWVVIG
ncbi:uncharacterized protein LOC102807543, partial [Saccoglossus kowalevskii]